MASVMSALIGIHAYLLAQWTGFSKLPGTRTSEGQCDLIAEVHRRYWSFQPFWGKVQVFVSMENTCVLCLLKYSESLNGSWIQNGMEMPLGICCLDCFNILCYGQALACPVHLVTQTGTAGTPIWLCTVDQKAMPCVRWRLLRKSDP